MMEAPFTPRIVMEGCGAYNANSALQASGVAIGLPLFKEAAGEIAIGDRDDPIVIADYGSSEGMNSLAPIRAAIGALRGRVGPDRAIVVAHTDLPGNDFSTLFEVVDKAIGSYARDDSNVFSSAVGRSFYRSVLPPNYVDLSWSSYAAQWLSRAPTSIPDHFYIQRSTGEVRAAFARQAKEDWETFLSLRARELRSGGRLVVVMPSLDTAGTTPMFALHDCANLVLADMVIDGAMTADERARMLLTAYGRTPMETLAPFANGAQFGGLNLESSAFSAVADGAWAQYERDGDAEALAARRAGFFRVTFAPSLASALTLNGEADAPKTFSDRLEAGLRQRLADHLSPIGQVVSSLSLKKT